MSLCAVPFICCTKCIPLTTDDQPQSLSSALRLYQSPLHCTCSCSLQLHANTAAAIRFNGMFQKVARREGFMEVYRAAQQQDIDNFVQFVGPAMSYPPAFSAKAYGVPGFPHGYQPNHIAQAVNLTQLQPPQQQNNSQHAKGSQKPRQPKQGDETPPRSNIVPFRKVSSPGNPNMPGGVVGHFVDEDAGQDTRPILLFDLNGTLTSHTVAKRGSGRSLMRPGIHHLRRLQVSSSRQLVHVTYT